MLEIRQASIAFDNIQLFSDLSFFIKEGEFGCISGTSGSGKTSLLRAILGFLPLQKGEIIFNGQVVRPQTVELIRRKIAYLPQEAALPVEWVHEMVKLPFCLKANKGKDCSEKSIYTVFDQLGLEHELLQKRIHEISGGQRQRIMLGICALLDKPLLIADEPTSALDGKSSTLVCNFLHSLAKKGSMILTVSHDKCLMEQCDKHIQIK